MRLIVVVGARPNVVKVGPLLPALERAGIITDVAFTGSREVAHPDDSRPGLSFYGVSIPSPKWFLDIGVSTEAVQTGRAMAAFEELFAREIPDAVVVVGDVNPTLAAAISAAKAGIPVIHLDAGLRCGDLGVAEEINRVLVSRIAAMHLAPTEGALENLEDEGVEPERIHFVGNIMAESVMRCMDDIKELTPAAEFGLAEAGYVLASFHRPENLNSKERLVDIAAGLGRSDLPVVVPDGTVLGEAMSRWHVEVPSLIRLIDAVPYQVMLALERDAAVIITDSSGVQEEACVSGTPCLTVRECTEQSATVRVGANRLVKADADEIARSLAAVSGSVPNWASPKRWDRAVSDRVVRAMRRGVKPLD